MAITPSTIDSAYDSAGAAVLTLSGYAVPAGDDKILVVIFHSESSGTHDSVTHNGVALTERASAFIAGTNRMSAWDLQLGSTTPTGDIVVTMSVAGLTIGLAVQTLIGAKQQVPEATNSATATSSPINTALTTLTDGAMIIDGISSGVNGTLAITQGPDQVEDVNLGGGSSIFGMSHRLGDAAGSHTLGWSLAGVNRFAHALVAYEEAVAAASGTKRYQWLAYS